MKFLINFYQIFIFIFLHLLLETFLHICVNIIRSNRFYNMPRKVVGRRMCETGMKRCLESVSQVEREKKHLPTPYWYYICMSMCTNIFNFFQYPPLRRRNLLESVYINETWSGGLWMANIQYPSHVHIVKEANIWDFKLFLFRTDTVERLMRKMTRKKRKKCVYSFCPLK